MTDRREAHDDERRQRGEFATSSAEDQHRVWHQYLYPLWQRWNAEHFHGQLKTPHLGYGRTPPRSLGYCTRTTDYGAPLQIIMHEALVFGTRASWVLNPMGEGHRRAGADLLLRLTVQQYVLEELGADEKGYYDCGPRFCQEVNRLGLVLALPSVVFDRAGPRDAALPICKGWPHNVRSTGYYGHDLTAGLMDRLSHPAASRRGRGPTVPPSLGVWDYILFLLAAGRTKELAAMAKRQADFLESLRKGQLPILKEVEEGNLDPDNKTPITIRPVFDPEWLFRNNGIAGKIVDGISAYRTYHELPILADALQDAGCDDLHIFRHLQARIQHAADCWVVRGLMAVSNLDLI